MLQAKYGIEVESVPLETPPDLQFGELATPIAFELARKLRKAPKVIAQEIVAALGPLRGFASFDIAGAGYINARLDRAAAYADGCGAGSRLHRSCDGAPRRRDAQVHSLVEHTSINPNKAAHIGHLRNAILGDTFVRLLRAAGQKVDVQNYIDNTGVQVADVVVGFLHLEGKSLADVRALARGSQEQGRADRLLLLGSLCEDFAVVHEREQTRRTRRGRSCAMPRCTRLSKVAMRRRKSPS